MYIRKKLFYPELAFITTGWYDTSISPKKGNIPKNGILQYKYINIYIQNYESHITMLLDMS